MATEPLLRARRTRSLHGLDMCGTELGVGHETSLGTGEGVGVGAGRMNCHCEQTHRNTLACGHQHVHLACRRVGVDTERLIDQVVGGVSHCGDHHGHVIAGVLRFDDASGPRALTTLGRLRKSRQISAR